MISHEWLMTNRPVKANGVELNLVTVGDGRPIMFMHGGLGLDHNYLRPPFDALSKVGQVIYYDHRGNGRSTAVAAPDQLDFGTLVSDAVALIEALGHERVILIGHSFGGFVAQEFAVKHPEGLSGLVLMNTVPAFDYQPTVSGTERQMAAFGKMFSQPMTSDREFRDVWSLVVQMYFREYDSEKGRDLDARTHYSHIAWNACGPMLAGFNTLDALPKIDVPTLVISGRHDPITPIEPGGDRISGLIPGATGIVYENSGHFPFMEEESAVLADLSEWISRLE